MHFEGISTPMRFFTRLSVLNDSKINNMASRIKILLAEHRLFCGILSIELDSFLSVAMQNSSDLTLLSL